MLADRTVRSSPMLSVVLVVLAAAVSAAVVGSAAPLGDTEAGAGGPTVTWVSHPVRRNETVMAFGEGLDAVTSVRVCAGTACQSVTPLDAWRHSVKFVVPADMPAHQQYTVHVCAGSGACTAAAVTGASPAPVNAPDAWWVQGDEGAVATPGGWVRVFGRSLAFDGNDECVRADAPVHAPASVFAELTPLPGGAASSSSSSSSLHRSASANHGTLDPNPNPSPPESAPKPLHLKAVNGSCFDVFFDLPASLAPGDYVLALANGLSASATTAFLSADPFASPHQHQHQQQQRQHHPKLASGSSGSGSGSVAVVRVRASPRQPSHAFSASPSEGGAGVQRALDEAHAAGGGVVTLGKGDFAMGEGQGLTVYPGTVLRGAVAGDASGSTLTWPAGETRQPAKSLVGASGAGAFAVESLTLNAPYNYRNVIADDPDGGSDGMRVRWVKVLAGAGPKQDAVPVRAAFFLAGTNWAVTDSDITHDGNCNSTFPRASIFDVQGASFGVIARNRFLYGCDFYDFEGTAQIIMEQNEVGSNGGWLSGGNSVSTYHNARNENFFFARNREADNPKALIFHETLTLDGAGGAYFGPLAAVSGANVTLAADPVYHPAPSVLPSWRGAVLIVMNGTAAGQWRRIASNAGRHWTLAAPFAVGAAPDHASFVSIVPFRGRMLVVGNNFTQGNVLQMYAISVDCIVAHNYAYQLSGGVNAWGRAPHAHGWQPSLYQQFLRNTLIDSSSLSSRTKAPTDAFGGPMNRAHVHRANVLSQGTGLAIHGNSSDVLVEGNHVAGMGAAGLVVDDTADHVLSRGNVLTGSADGEAARRWQLSVIATRRMLAAADDE